MGRRSLEEPSGLEVGDIVYCASMKLRSELMPGTFVESSVRANRGKVLVVLLLGEESASNDGDKVDVVEVMRAMGWEIRKP